MDVTGLITIGGALAGGMTAPDAPDVKPYDPDYIEKKSLSEYMPQIEELMSSQADMALSMMRGELPASVVDQIKMFAGERAMRGGMGASATRVSNITARDLGLSALDLMETGQQYANYLVNQTRSLQQDDYAIDIANANMAYDAWASNAQSQWNNFQIDSDRHANLVEGFVQGGSQLATSYALSQTQKQQQANYDKLLATLGKDD